MNINRTCSNLCEIVEYLNKIECNLSYPSNEQYTNLMNKLGNIKLDIINIEKELRELQEDL